MNGVEALSATASTFRHWTLDRTFRIFPTFPLAEFTAVAMAANLGSPAPPPPRVPNGPVYLKGFQVYQHNNLSLVSVDGNALAQFTAPEALTERCSSILQDQGSNFVFESF